MGYPSPEFCNPSTFFMKCMNPEGLLVQNIEKTGDFSIKLTAEIKNEFKQRVKNMIKYYRDSDEYNSIKPNLNNEIKIDDNANTVSWFKQFYMIAQRGFKNELRNPLDVKFKAFGSLFFAVLIIIIFGGVKMNIFNSLKLMVLIVRSI